MRKQFETISDLRAEIKSLQADNLKLYEKVRYMQSYRDSSAPVAGPSGTSASSLGANSGSGSGGGGILTGILGRSDEIGRYKDKYEESMNPFEAFKGRVSISDTIRPLLTALTRLAGGPTSDPGSQSP